MPFARCKFYTDNGEPINGGCRKHGAGCVFIHPDEPNWANAPPPRDRNVVSGNFQPRGERGNRGPAGPSARGSSASGRGGAPDARWGRNSRDERGTDGGWDTGSGWNTSGGRGADTRQDAGGSGSMWKSISDLIQSDNPSNATSREASSRTGAGKNDGGETQGWGNSNGWGGWGNDKDGQSTWGSTWNDSSGGGGDNSAGGNDKGEAQSWGDGSGWGGWGNDKAGQSTWGSTWNDNPGGSGDNNAGGNNKGEAQGRGDSNGWGGWGNDKAGQSTRGSTWNDNSGGGGDNIDNAATTSWGPPEPMAVDNQTSMEPERSEKQKVVPPPPRPRIRIPNSEIRKEKITGTNNEPLGPRKWGEPHSSNPVTTPISSTPIVTPSESTGVKRKREVEQPQIFSEYVMAWERAVRAQYLVNEADANIQRWRRTQKSACYARIGEAGKQRLDEKRVEYVKEHGFQKQQLSAAIKSLIEIQDANLSKLNLRQRYNIEEEAGKYLSEAKHFLDESRAIVVANVLKDKNNVQSDNIQEREHASGDNATLVDSFRTRVQNLEERFEQAQTELTLRRQNDIRSEIDNILSSKISALREARQREIDRVASQPCPDIIIPPAALKNMEGTAQQVSEMVTKVPQTVEDIRVLLFRVDSITKRVTELEQEVSTNKETYRQQVQNMAAKKEETEQRLDLRLQHIQEQFERMVAIQPLSSPAAETATSPITRDSQVKDQMMERLRPVFEALLDKFYEREVRPSVESLQRVVMDASLRHQEEAIKVLWGKMQPAMNMVEGVSQWLDSQELGLTAPIEKEDILGVSA